MEFPGLYGDLQTGFEPIKFLDTRSVWVGHVIIDDTDFYGKKFESTDKVDRIRLSLHFEDNEKILVRFLEEIGQ